MVRVVHPGSRILDPDPDFLPIPDPGSRIQGSKRHRILDPGVKKAMDPRSESATLEKAHLNILKKLKIVKGEWNLLTMLVLNKDAKIYSTVRTVNIENVTVTYKSKSSNAYKESSDLTCTLM
jgi:hypothetical protein